MLREIENSGKSHPDDVIKVIVATDNNRIFWVVSLPIAGILILWTFGKSFWQVYLGLIRRIIALPAKVKGWRRGSSTEIRLGDLHPVFELPGARAARRAVGLVRGTYLERSRTV